MEKQADIIIKKSFVVITGASRGLGRCIALQFGVKFPSGSVLLLMARDVNNLESVKSEMMASDPKLSVVIALYDQGNTDTGYFDGMFDNILAENKLSKDDFDQAVIVHNCATIGDITKTAVQLSDANHVRTYFDINLVGMILLNTTFFTTFSDSAQSRVVVNMTSGGSRYPLPSFHLYHAGKAAREMFFSVLATEEPSIRILTYNPGIVNTDLAQDVETNASSSFCRQLVHDMRQDSRLLTPEESVSDLVKVLEDNTFDNAVYVSKQRDKVTPYLKHQK